LDLDALQQALEFLVASNYRSKTVVFIVATELQTLYKKAIEDLVANYAIDELVFGANASSFDMDKYIDCTILIKGYRNSSGQILAQKFKLQKHETVVEVDMDALRNNLNYFRSKIKPTTKLLVMVKAFAYGAGAEKIAAFLERNNVDYLGVAYGDEGVALRKKGVKIPILVMNAEPYSYEDIINYELEPALFSLKSLEEFAKTLINLNKENYPVHLKFDTGMHRLGFSEKEIQEVIETIQAQPEIRLQGIYSHLSDADNEDDTSYSKKQIQLFDTIITQFRQHIQTPFIAHLLNTEGILHFSESQYDMVRMGIGLYGHVSNKEVLKYLSPAITWKTIISQIRTLEAGERVSYNGRYITHKTERIATIPVGYADGLKRLYSKNRGEVVINNQRCPIVGTICMDMCMVDVTNVPCEEGDSVEIIGPTITLQELAKKMETISYEVLTSISRRVHRVYLNE
jgi:alanine racemase